MNYKLAMKVFNAVHPERTIVRVYEYSGGYLFIAPQTGRMFDDSTDPMFLMDKKMVNIYTFLPPYDLNVYQEAMKNLVYDAMCQADIWDAAKGK